MNACNELIILVFLYPLTTRYMVAGSKERVVEVERFGELRLPLGGKTGYIGVRGGQGPKKDKYQGYTKDKKHTTKAVRHGQGGCCGPRHPQAEPLSGPHGHRGQEAAR